MNTINKISDVTYSDIAEYIRLDEVTQNDINTLNNLICIAKAYIMQYTGRKEEELDDFKDFVIVLFILCQDMWDNRALYVDKTNLNHVVDSILSLHAVNLL